MSNRGYQLGYACINMTLSEKGITTNRGMIKSTMIKKGARGVGELFLKNVEDLEKVIKWNVDNDIYLYRLSSSLWPWMSEFEFEELPQAEQISKKLKEIGDFYQTFKHARLTFHPGHFTLLGSPNEEINQRGIIDLNKHAEIMDLLGLPRSYKAPINIHLGGSYDSKENTYRRFAKNWEKLSEGARSRLVVENDDKASQYSVNDLLNLHRLIGIPITFDYHHHRFSGGIHSEYEAINNAYITWPSDIVPIVHYSSCRKSFEDPSCKAQAHADWIYEKINDYGLALDIELESKAKELALLKYRKDLNEHYNHRQVLLESYKVI